MTTTHNNYELPVHLDHESFSVLESNIDDFNNNPLRDADPDIHFFSNPQTYLKSEYFTEQSFNNKFANCDSQFSLFHLNIRSVPANLTSLELYLSSLRNTFDVIALSETWLSEHNSDLFCLPGCVMESRIRGDRAGGGVSLILRDSLRYKVRDDFSKSSDCIESVSVEITSLDRRVIVVAVYRPPGTDIDSFSDSLTEFLSIIKREKNWHTYLATST